MPLKPASRLHSCLEFIEASLAPQARGRDWYEEVQRVAGDLENLNRVTERDFLNVGGKLMEFLSASHRIHSEVEGLTALLSGEAAENACNALDAVRRYTEEMQRRSEGSACALMTLQASAQRIQTGFSTFREIALSFTMTAILARMEAAHLATSQQNLKDLAGDVRTCSDAIRLCADQVLEAAGNFNDRIGSTLPAVSRFEAIQLGELPSLMKAVDADLERFRTRRRETVETSALIASAQSTVARELGAVAGSLQFHDITRQRLEHVIAALRDLPRKDTGSPISGEAAVLVSLQKAQLESAGKGFCESIVKIDGDLRSIASRIGEMAAAGKRITAKESAGKTAAGLGAGQSDADGGSSFFEEMQGRFAAVARAVAELESLESGSRRSVADLQCTSRALGAAVDEVQSLEGQLGRISINAVVSASHLGARGEALKVIAESIRDLRNRSAARSGEAKAALEAIHRSIAGLEGGGLRETGEEGRRMVAELNAGVEQLRAAGVSGAQAAAKIAAASDVLFGELQNASEGFRAGSVFAETVRRCCDSLHLVASAASHASRSEFRAGHSAAEERYTMHSERHVHRAAMAGLTAPVAHPAANQVEEVEFF